MCVALLFNDFWPLPTQIGQFQKHSHLRFHCCNISESNLITGCALPCHQSVLIVQDIWACSIAEWLPATWLPSNLSAECMQLVALAVIQFNSWTHCLAGIDNARAELDAQWKARRQKQSPQKVAALAGSSKASVTTRQQQARRRTGSSKEQQMSG